MERDLYLPSLPGRPRADFFSSIDLPQDWLAHLYSLGNMHAFAPFDMQGKLITFVCEYKCGSALAASRQLALHLCSGQHQRQALGIGGDLFGATIVDSSLTIYVSRWEQDGFIVCTIYFSFIHFYQLNNNKWVYPTPYQFSLASFPGFLKCYIFLCKLADHIAKEATNVFNAWKTAEGRAELEKVAQKASKQPWRPNVPATSTRSRKYTRFEGDPTQDDSEPYLVEGWYLSEDMGDEPLVMGDGG